MTFKPLFISAFETALNHYLQLDDNVTLFLKPLESKIIAITILPFNETLYLCPADDKIQIIDYSPEEADTHITGSLVALGLMSLSSNPKRAFFSGEVSITGDLTLGHQFQQIFKKLDIDLEKHLAHYTGESFAHKLSQFAHQTHDWHQETFNGLRLNITEFLQDESKDLPPEPEIALFMQHVDQLQEDSERLEARINQLGNTQ